MREIITISNHSLKINSNDKEVLSFIKANVSEEDYNCFIRPSGIIEKAFLDKEGKPCLAINYQNSKIILVCTENTAEMINFLKSNVVDIRDPNLLITFFLGKVTASKAPKLKKVKLDGTLNRKKPKTAKRTYTRRENTFSTKFRRKLE